MIMKYPHVIKFCLLLCLIPSGCANQDRVKIPFPDALEIAAIVQDSIPVTLENSLLLGNGDINGLLNVIEGKLIIRLSKNDIGDWRNDSSIDSTLIPWRMLKEMGAKNKLKTRAMGWDRYSYATPIPCGKIVIDLNINESTEALLDIKRAVAVIGEPEKPAAMVRCLYQANVFLIVGGTGAELLSHEVDHLPEAGSGMSDKTITLYQELPAGSDWPGMSYAVAMATRGNIRAISVVSSFDAEDPLTEAVAIAENTMKTRVGRLISIHEDEWNTFWSKSGIQLDDEYLTATWYRNLYFLRTVSRPETAAVGLFAGLVNDGKPAWHSSHTMNYNAEQPFWTAFNCNHLELSSSYRLFIEAYLENARWLCRKLFDFDGAYFPHNISTYNSDHATSTQDGGGAHMHIPWGYSTCITGWAVQNPWWEYEYGGRDPEFLREIYPMLRDAALFYSNFIDTICEKRPDGKVMFGPSVSPEHFGFSNDLSKNWNDITALVFARFALETGIESAQVLKTDGELVTQFKKSLELLPDYPTYGEGEEQITVSVEGAVPMEYNIPVPVFPVFPGELVSWFSPEDQKALFIRTLYRLESNGNNDAMILCHARARLSMPGTYEYVVSSIRNRQRPNGTLTLNVLGKRFNAFGHYTEQFAASAVISELLLQSVDDVIRIFPAWPLEKGGTFSDLRAKGGFLVSSEVRDGKIMYVTIKATSDQLLKVYDPFNADFDSNLTVTKVGKEIQCQMLKGQVLELKVKD